MEACEKIDGAHKKIVLNVKTGKGILAIEIKNTCEGKNNSSDFLSTKKDANNHGYGLKSIREIVERYHGNMEITQKENWFTLFLYIPLPDYPIN